MKNDQHLQIVFDREPLTATFARRGRCLVAGGWWLGINVRNCAKLCIVHGGSRRIKN